MRLYLILGYQSLMFLFGFFQLNPYPTIYQDRGFTIGEWSETAQEAINAATKDVASFSFRGSEQNSKFGLGPPKLGF